MTHPVSLKVEPYGAGHERLEPGDLRHDPGERSPLKNWNLHTKTLFILRDSETLVRWQVVISISNNKQLIFHFICQLLLNLGAIRGELLTDVQQGATHLEVCLHRSSSGRCLLMILWCQSLLLGLTE